MIAGHDYQGFVQIDPVDDGFHRLVQGDRVAQRAVGVTVVAAVIDASTLHQQQVAFGVLGQNIDGLAGHFRQRRFSRRVLPPIVLEVHV